MPACTPLLIVVQLPGLYSKLTVRLFAEVFSGRVSCRAVPAEALPEASTVPPEVIRTGSVPEKEPKTVTVKVRLL